MIWELLILVALLLAALLYAQRKHYEYLLDKDAREGVIITPKLLKDFEETKQRVDALALKAGFRL